MSNSPMMTRPEAAKWCRVSLAAFDAHVRPQLPYKQVGRRVLFHLADLDAWSQAEAAKPRPKGLGAPSLRTQGNAGGPLLRALNASPEAAALRARITASLERRAAREARVANA
jgi:hypothetical protein